MVWPTLGSRTVEEHTEFSQYVCLNVSYCVAKAIRSASTFWQKQSKFIIQDKTYCIQNNPNAFLDYKYELHTVHFKYVGASSLICTDVKQRRRQKHFKIKNVKTRGKMKTV